MQQNYYCVTAKCGHVGRKNYIPIAFAVMSTSAKDASRAVRQYPRVKHHHRQAILSCKQISYNTYQKLLQINRSDPYLMCKNHQDQTKIVDIHERIIVEREHDEEDYEFVIGIRKYKARKNHELDAWHQKNIQIYQTYEWCE